MVRRAASPSGLVWKRTNTCSRPIVPRKVARISEYAAKRLPLPGSSQLGPWATPAMSGTAEPAGKVTAVPVPNSCRPGPRSRDPDTGEPSRSPLMLTTMDCLNRSVTSSLTTTRVAAVKVEPVGAARSGRPSACQCRRRNITGTASAVSFSQYWNACTNVIARMPPRATLPVTTTATTRAPSAYGPPVTVWRVRRAPCICGTR